MFSINSIERFLSKKRKLDQAKPDQEKKPGVLYEFETGKIWALYQFNTHKTIEDDYLIWPGIPDGEKYVCLNDSYEFDGADVFGICLEYFDKRNIYLMHPGRFCSGECVLRYMDDRGMNAKIKMNTITFLKNVKKQIRIINMAPPVEWLQRYQPKSGITIEEYRQAFVHSTTTILDPILICHAIYVEEIADKEDKTKKRQHANETFTNKKSMQETLPTKSSSQASVRQLLNARLRVQKKNSGSVSK